MAGPHPLSDDELLHLRLSAQLLDRRRRRSALELVRHHIGVQAQLLDAASLALGVRSASLSAEAVTAARLERHSIVLCWAMRGTLHLVAAEDHGWLVPLTTEPGIAKAHRRLRQEGVPPEQPERAVRLIEAMLEREGPLTRAEIAERLERAGIHIAGQAIAHLTWLAAATGRICHGPERGGRPCFVLTHDWLGKTSTLGRDEALAELAGRYLAAHEPAEPADLAFWAGLRLSDAKSAWKAISGRLAEVATAGGPLWTLRSLRAGPENRGPEPVRLLPAFDEYLLGWKDRRVIVAPEHWAAVNRGGGWLHPVLLFNGRLVATWRVVARAGRRTVLVTPFTALPPAVTLGAESQAAHMAAFLGTPLMLEVAEPSRRR